MIFLILYLIGVILAFLFLVIWNDFFAPDWDKFDISLVATSYICIIGVIFCIFFHPNKKGLFKPTLKIFKRNKK